MRTLVIDVAADSGGALTVLNQFYDIFSADKQNEYIICVSVVDLKPTDNINVLKFPWVKKSWFHRIWFDNFFCKRLIKEYNVDSIFSLQNTLISGTKLPQTLYLHQPIPYSKHKFSLFENKKFWIYQNIISKFIHNSVRKAEKVIVQTNWMKDAVLEIDKIEESKITVIHPELNVKIEKNFIQSEWRNLFFYPSSNYSYKNHKVIFEAVKELAEQNISDFQVILTLNEENLPHDCIEIYNSHKDYFKLIGNISHEKVMEFYSKSILIFPSYLETFGLPLLEARMTECPIIAADMPFSREILEGYEKVHYFSAFSCSELTEEIMKYIK